MIVTKPYPTSSTKMKLAVNWPATLMKILSKNALVLRNLKPWWQMPKQEIAKNLEVRATRICRPTKSVASSLLVTAARQWYKLVVSSTCVTPPLHALMIPKFPMSVCVLQKNVRLVALV